MRVLFSNISIRTKFLLSFIIVIMLVIGVVSLLSYFISAQSLRDEISKFSSQLTAQIGMNMEAATKDMANTVFVEMGRSNMYRYLPTKDYTDDYSHITRVISIDRILMTIAGNNKFIIYISVFDKYGGRYDFTRSGFEGAYIPNLSAEERESLRALWGKAVWSAGDERFIYMKRAIFHIDTLEYLGTICAGVDVRYLKQYGIDNRREGAEIIGLNAAGEPMIWNDPLCVEISGYLSENDLLGQNTLAQFQYNNTQYMYVVQNSPNKAWKIVQIIPNKMLTRSHDLLKIWLAAIGVAAAAFSVLLAYLITGRIMRGMKLLVKNIREASQGNFDIEAETRGADEIGTLTQEFNALFSRMDSLIESIHDEKLRTKNAEYKALQFEYSMLLSQMNPHFLCNSLETIKSIALINGEKKISEMLYLLGCILRENLRITHDQVELAEEISYVKNYLDFHQLCFPNKLDLKYDIEDRLYTLLVPRFILQPIVENAIIHGIEKMLGKGYITIICRLVDDNLLIITVEDNGAGFDAALNNPLAEPEYKAEEVFKRHGRIGLNSVDKRVKFLYGDSYGLSIESSPGKGTRVSISLPAIS